MDGPPGQIRDRSGGRAGVKCRNAAAPCRQGGGAGHGASRRPRPTGIPAHGTGRPSVPPLQKCRDLSDERRRGRSQTGPRAFARGARIQDVTLIRPFGPPPPLLSLRDISPYQGESSFPLEEGRLAGGQRPPLTRGRNLLGRAGEDTRPYKIWGIFRFCRRGRRPRRPAGAQCAPLHREKGAHCECSLGEGIPPAASRHPPLTRGALAGRGYLEGFFLL